MATPLLHQNTSSSRFGTIFAAALEEYTQKTGTNLATHELVIALEACDSPEAVLGVLVEQAHAFNQYQNGEWKVRLSKRLESMVGVLLGLLNVVGEGVGMKFPPVKAILAGIGLLLTAAAEVSTSYRALVDLFKCFELYLGRLKVFTMVPKLPFAVEDLLVRILAEFLGVLALATQQIKQGPLKKFTKKLLGENEIELVLQRLDRLTTEESRLTATQTLEVIYGLFNNMKEVMADRESSTGNIQKSLVTMQQILEGLNKMKREQHQQDAQRWLFAPDPSINHNAICDVQYHGTATWLIQGDVYQEWKRTGSLLWIYGKPGSGKSVLCSSIIKDIEGKQPTGVASVIYYYFDFNDVRKQDRRGLLSSLLIQLCARSDPRCSVLWDLYEVHGRGLRQPSEGALIRCLKAMLALPRQEKVYIIVDAPDECPSKPGIPSPREKVLELLKELVVQRIPHLRICITNRPEVDIRTVLHFLASHQVHLDGEIGHRNDINDFVKSVVESDPNMRHWGAEEKQQVILVLSQKGDGMFRWIACQLDTLRRYFRGTIRHALDELPKTLDETYERMLLAIDEEKSEYAIRIFQCMAVSRRPLCVKELAEVIPVQLDAGSIPRLNVGQRQRDAEEAILSACSSLVTIIKPNISLHNSDFRAVQFSHCSVKKFLTSERLSKSERGLSRYHVSPEPAHTILAQCCIGTLLQFDHRTDRDSIHSFPLADYAAQNWVFHAQFDGVSSKIQDAMDRLFDAEGPYFAAWVWLHDIDDPLRGPLVSRLPERPKASPLYYSVLCGFRDLVGRLATACKRDINATGGNHGTPLLAAVDRGHLEIVQLLLELGADVNAYHEGDSALHKALRSRRFDIMLLLLTFKADVNSRDKHGVFPLLRALESGDFGIVQTLLHHGAKADTRDDCDYTLLHHASQSGNIELARLLLGFRADVNLRDDCNSTPLHEASRFGNPNVARLLLDNGADVNARDNKGCSPLHKAIRLDVDVVQLLLQYGADAHIQDSDCSTPLHRAAQDGNPEMVLVLLEHNATYVDARDAKDSTPLHLASERGHLDVARLLFEYGADVDAVNNEAQTPSSIASARGHRELARYSL